MFETLKKFGLSHCDLQDMIDNVSILLRLLVVNIDKRNTKKFPIISYIVTISAALGYFYTYIISSAWFVFWRCQETGDKIAAIIVFSLSVASEISVFKLLFMYIYGASIRDILEGYLNLDKENIFESRLDIKLKNKLRNIKKRAVIYWCMIISNGILYILKPILLPGRHLMEDSFELLGLDPILESPNYEMAFVSCVLSIFFTCYLLSTVSAFLIVMTGYTESQLLVLSEELMNLWSNAEKEIKKNRGNSNDAIINNTPYTTDENIRMNIIVNIHLKKIIKSHKTNVELMRQIDRVFSGSFLVEFLLVTISLIAELLGGLENTYLELPFALVQLTMDCITGQRLIDACNLFNQAVYNSKWENFDLKNAKMVLFMLQTSQKTLCLSAGGVTTLNFVCLMSVLKMSFSTYTTLRSYT